MGMRGIIAVEQGDKVYKVTTVQWLTVGDQSWKSFTEGMTAAEKAESAKEFAENITKYNHIGLFLSTEKGRVTQPGTGRSDFGWQR